MFHHLKPFAVRLGAAFQKVNFLRDLQADHAGTGRAYFPDVDLAHFCGPGALRRDLQKAN